MTAPQPSYPATPDTSHPAFAGSTNQLLIIGDAGGWAVNNGVGIGNPTVNGTTSSTTNSLGNALVFNGSNTYISVSNTNVPTTEFTVLWGGSFEALSGVTGIVDLSNGSTNGWSLFTSGTDMYLSGNHYSGDLLSTGWGTGTVLHGAARNKSGTGISIFRNGVNISSSGIALSGVSSPSNPLFIGQLRVSSPRFITATLNYFYIFDKYLDDSVISSIAADPYAIFLGSGGNNYVITPSGSINFSGSIPTYRQKILEPSGGLKMLGSGILNKQKIFLPSGNISFNGSTNVVKQKVIVPSGGTVFSGTSNVIKTKVITPSGEITFNGTASLSGATSYIITPTGGINFSGSAIMIKSHIVIPTGSIVFGGSAPISSNTVIATVSTRLPLTGVGL